MLQVPSEANPSYGYMWWLSDIKEGPLKGFVYFAAGFGGNYTIVDEEYDLLVVVRWMPKLIPFMKKVRAAVLRK